MICTDKTGTLTENRLRVTAALPEAGVRPAQLLETAILASGVRASAGGLEVSAADPLDVAVVTEAREQGIDVARLLASSRQLDQVPFDSERRRVTAVVVSDGVHRVVVKGAPETVLPRTRIEHGECERVVELVESLAAQGIRVLAVAERPLAAELRPGEEPDVELRLLGLIGFRDPLRTTVPAAVAEARAAGIGVMMLTGDHPTTAAAIGRALGLSPDAIRARVEPAEKLRIVEALQDRGEIVAVTGDGVNDAAALRRADVGVAMGRAGTEAAREASAVVLSDDDFSTIVAAVREGRRIGDNIRKFVAFLLSANLGEVVAFGAAVLAGLGPPLTVVQVLVLNVLTDGLPAVALSLDPAADDVMARGPERRGRLFTARTWTVLGALGLAVGGTAIAAFLVGRSDGGVSTGQTMAFLTIGIAELLLVFSLRSQSAPAWREPRNGTLLLAVGASLGLLAAFVLVPAFREPFGTVTLDGGQLGVVVGLAVLPAALVEVLKAIRRHGGGSVPAGGRGASGGGTAE
jgi:Ca2+-transporting ATPase